MPKPIGSARRSIRPAAESLERRVVLSGVAAADVDTTGPVVSEVDLFGAPVPPGGVVTAPVPRAVVTFNENLATAGGAAGAHSVTNPANWGLTFNGQDLPGRITAIAFGLNGATGRYEAALTLNPALASDGDYVLTAKQAIQDTAGNALDGDRDGVPGGNFASAFAVHQLVPAGPEFRANATTADDQFQPAVARSAGGDFVVAWTSNAQDETNQGTYGVYAQRYDAAGAPRGGEFLVNTTTAGNQFRPAVAIDAAGDFVVAWQSSQETGYGVYAQRYDAAGVRRGGEFRVNTTTAGDQQRPAVAMDAAGDFVVTWQSSNQDRAGSQGVYAQRYDAAGATRGGEFRVNTVVDGNQQVPAVAMDAAGDFVVTWESFGQDGSFYGVYAQRYAADGAARGSEFLVNTTVADRQRAPRVASAAGGDFVVAWMSYLQDGDAYGVYFQRYNAAGVPQGGETRANTTTAAYQTLPAVAMDAAGDFVVTWQSDDQDGSASGVYGQRFAATGVAQGGEFRANATTAFNQEQPAVAMDAVGGFVVAWQSEHQDPGFTRGVYAQRYKANDPPTFPGVTTINAVENGPATSVALASFFADDITPRASLNFSLLSVVNPGVLSPVSLGGGGTLVLTPAANAVGAAAVTVRATDAAGLFADASFVVTVRPAWLTVPTGGVWSVAGTPTSYTLTLTTGDFVIPSDPAALNPNLNLTVASPVTLTVNADVHIAGLTLTGTGARVTFNGPTGGGLSFAGRSVPLVVPVPEDDHPAPPPPALTVGDVTRPEGNAGTTTFRFPVTLDRAAAAPVRVYYATANVTAAHGSDYLAAGGVLTFKPGETSKVVTVQVKGDALFEADERFRVVLYGAAGAVVADGTGVGTIRNDDAPPPPRVSVAGAGVAEGDAGLRAVPFDVTLDHPTAAAVVVRYATADGTARAGGDYIPAAGAFAFKPGETRKRVVVNVRGDATKEADETFFLDLTGPAGTTRARGIIRNDDVVAANLRRPADDQTAR